MTVETSVYIYIEDFIYPIVLHITDIGDVNSMKIIRALK